MFLNFISFEKILNKFEYQKLKNKEESWKINLTFVMFCQLFLFDILEHLELETASYSLIEK